MNAGWSIADDAKYRNREARGTDEGAVVKLMTVTYASEPDLWVENIRELEANLVLREWTGGQWSYKVTGPASIRICYNSRAPHSTAAPSAVWLRLEPHGHRAQRLGLHVTANLLDTETFTTRARGWPSSGTERLRHREHRRDPEHRQPHGRLVVCRDRGQHAPAPRWTQARIP